MPEYLYRSSDEISCDHCREGFAVHQSVKDPPLAICPRCGASVQRQLTAFQVGGAKFSCRRAKEAGFKVMRKDDSGGYRED